MCVPRDKSEHLTIAAWTNVDKDITFSTNMSGIALQISSTGHSGELYLLQQSCQHDRQFEITTTIIK